MLGLTVKVMTQCPGVTVPPPGGLDAPEAVFVT
jgi:hypothetical protein